MSDKPSTVIEAEITAGPSYPPLSATSEFAVPDTPAPGAPPATPEAPTVSQSVNSVTEVEPKENEADGPGEAGEEGEPSAPEPPAAPRTGIAGRMGELAAARKAAEARADKLADGLERALDALARATTPRPAETPAPTTEPPPQVEPRPSRDTFEDPDSYDAALVEWSTRQATRLATAEFDRKLAAERQAETQRAQEAQQRQQGEALVMTWNERRIGIMADPQYADFAEVAENPDLAIPATVVPALLHAENGPQVLYHLGKNPAEAARIAALPPFVQAIEIGRLSATLAAPPRPAVSRTPRPIVPVGGRADAGPKDPNDMTTEEYAAQRLDKMNAERHARLNGRRVN